MYEIRNLASLILFHTALLLLATNCRELFVRTYLFEDFCSSDFSIGTIEPATFSTLCQSMNGRTNELTQN